MTLLNGFLERLDGCAVSYAEALINLTVYNIYKVITACRSLSKAELNGRFVDALLYIRAVYSKDINEFNTALLVGDSLLGI